MKTIIEKVAINLAAEFYEQNRMMGNWCIDPKTRMPYKDQRSYCRKNFELFIPKAVEAAISLLHNPSTPDEVKEEIYDAIQERLEFDAKINGVSVNQYLKH